ncbi:MAG: DDE-type integrase/transposase/recombinase [Rhabdochlamydiaceae bacterium]
MPNNEAEERYRWIVPILTGTASIEEALKFIPFSERTVKYWLANYRKYGLSGLRNESRAPHSCPWQTPQETKDAIIDLRKTYHVGGKKIFWKIQKQGLDASEKTVNRILKKEGLMRKYRTKRKADEIWQPQQYTVPGEMIEVDVKYGVKRGENQWFYQFTAKDKASRWRLLGGFDTQDNYHSLQFLDRLITKSPFRIQSIKTDNGSIFTSRYLGYERSTDPLHPRYHAFDVVCIANNISHFLIDPGKPAQNGAVENSHSLDQRIFYDHLKTPRSLEEYRYRLELWNMWYNDLENIALNGLTPNEYLYRFKVQNVLS